MHTLLLDLSAVLTVIDAAPFLVKIDKEPLGSIVRLNLTVIYIAQDCKRCETLSHTFGWLTCSNTIPNCHGLLPKGHPSPSPRLGQLGTLDPITCWG